MRMPELREQVGAALNLTWSEGRTPLRHGGPAGPLEALRGNHYEHLDAAVLTRKV